MDPRERADVALARARARGAYVVTPDDAVSPMDAANTVQIPRSVVSAADSNHDEPDSTMVISAGMARGQQPPYPGNQQGYPQAHGHQQTNRQQQPGHQTGPHQPVPYPGNQQQGGQQPGGHQQPGQQPPGPQQGSHQQGGHQQGGNYQQHNRQQGNQYQSGQHQPVPPPMSHGGYNEQHGYPDQGYQEHGYQEQAPQQRQPALDEQPPPRQLDGLVPTTQEPAIQRSTLSRRLDGH
jgi:hypothetical protein